MTELNQDMDLDNLLDETIDDLADMPETKPFPDGAHLVTLKIKRVTDDKKKPVPGKYIVEAEYISEVELSDPDTAEENRSKEGDKCAVWIHTLTKEGKKNELGQGQLKIIVKPLAEHLGVTTVSEVIAATEEGLQVIAVTKIRKAKAGSGYEDSMDIKQVQVHTG